MAKDKLVSSVEKFTDAVSDMRHAMENTPEKAQEQRITLTEKQKKFPNSKYLEPVVTIPTRGNKHPEMEKQREYLTEYVEGIFESIHIHGNLEFYLTGLPGDPYCKWSIPPNKPIAVPRFVAKHLETNLCWREMQPLGRNNEPKEYHDDEMMTPFTKFEYKKRGTFHPINSY